MTAAAVGFRSSGHGWCAAAAQPMGARRGGERRQIVLQCSAATSSSSSRRGSRAVCLTSASFRLMDYTISLQVQNQLAVFPTHVCQSYSVELQVHPFSISPLRVILFRACFLLNSLWSQSRSCARTQRCLSAEGMPVAVHADWRLTPPRFLLRMAAGSAAEAGLKSKRRA